MIRFHNYKKAQKELKIIKKHNQFKIYQFKIYRDKTYQFKIYRRKIINLRFIKLKKHLSGKK